MIIFENGKYRNATPEELKELAEMAEKYKQQIEEKLAPTVEEQIEELRESIDKLKELFTPLLKLLGGNK